MRGFLILRRLEKKELGGVYHLLASNVFGQRSNAFLSMTLVCEDRPFALWRKISCGSLRSRWRECYCLCTFMKVSLGGGH
jgi:hypothetical protein